MTFEELARHWQALTGGGIVLYSPWEGETSWEMRFRSDTILSGKLARRITGSSLGELISRASQLLETYDG